MLNRIAILAALPATVCAAAPAYAAPALAPLFSDHAVLQRERPISVWGTADPGEEITVTLGSASATARADGSGAWRVELPAMQAGGPYRLTASGTGGSSAKAEDVLIGDVWLCSGQSNMELAVDHSIGADGAGSPPDPKLRLFTVPRKAAEAPLAQVEGGPWLIAGPDSVPSFSAACYFMVRDLRASEDVPIGAIHAAWGGTQIRAWMSADAIAAIGDEDSRMFAFHRDNPATSDARLAAEWERWWRSQSGDASGAEPWSDSSQLEWTPVPAIGSWETWDVRRLASYDGMVWFRKQVTLSAAEANGQATVELGAIDDQDQVWVNGRRVGGQAMWDAQRKYAIPAGVLRTGANEIVVNAFDTGGPGGFSGPSERLRLVFADGAAKPLGSGWEYSVPEQKPGQPPRAVWDFPMGFTWIYNAMIAPLRDYGLAGVAWYQGEADVGSPGSSYSDRLAEWMRDWRGQFRNPELPFLIVSLANFGAPQIAPEQDSWAELRDQQRIAAARDANAELVVAMDLGERTDIHPANKLDLGHRLARAARRLVYGGSEPTGPEAVRARRAGTGVEVEFAGVTGALRSWSANRVTSVELCAETQASCRYADATVEGSKLRVAGDGRPVTRVRYGWSAAPVTNLYDEVPLPVGPFELPVQ